MKRKKILTMFLLTATLLNSSTIVFASSVTPVNSKETNIEVATTTYAVVNTATTMYTGKYYEGIVCSVPKGAVVEIRDSDTNWCRVLYNHKLGYIKTSYLTFK